MKNPVRVHDVQKLTGCLAALSRFISRLGEKALPLYRLMKKSDKFEWTPEACSVCRAQNPAFHPAGACCPNQQRAFTALYCSHWTSCQYSAHGRAGRRRQSLQSSAPSVLYFWSLNSVQAEISSLSEVGLWNLFDHEKSCTVLLRPLGFSRQWRSIIRNSEHQRCKDATGWVAKWAIELLPLDIKFEAKKAIKSQAIVDFLAEWVEQQQPT